VEPQVTDLIVARAERLLQASAAATTN